VEFEIRNLAADDPGEIVAALRAAAEGIADAARVRVPEAEIRIEVTNAYPGLDTPTDAAVVGFARSLAGGDRTIRVAFGTEGGLFAERLGIPTVVCGPGSMAQGHRPDEFVAAEQIARCDAMLAALVDRLEAGL
jgi:acetylornithine deacetylase